MTLVKSQINEIPNSSGNGEDESPIALKKKKAKDGPGALKDKREELKRSEERYHKMIEEVEDYAILLLDRDGIVQNWNKGAERIKGYTQEEIVGKNFRIFYLPEDREKKLPEQLMEQAVREGKALHEGWRLRKDGTRFWGSIVITTLHDEHGQIMGFSKVTRDLTDIKAATDQIKDYARELEFQNKELQQFAYAAAHDLKEPLRKLQFYLSAIVETLAEKIPDKEKTYLNNSVSSAERMSSLIEDLLRYSATSMVADQFEAVDLTAVMEEVKNFYQDYLADGSISIRMNGPAGIWGIKFQIRQLFDNLIGNAIKYGQKDHPVQIDVSCAREYHQFAGEPGLNPVKSYFKITIRDNGIGFEPEHAQKIFDLFQRLHSRSEYPGSGVGLAICKKIVQNHKGFIEAEGKPGEGSAFTIYLPCL
ncbi:MAG: PAS domain S-box protein [Bacteroidota bacterium]|nr:PAS domain S-box protein [Bacteroidota bacterium]MDP4213399.1 PAS domain S-box protein [Bacteroidota bacterium]MDP4251233.1 PAS domain S-box protein [Bacteroidota bacterium]